MILLYNLLITIVLLYSRYWNNIYIKDIVFWVVFSFVTSTISVLDKNKIFSFKKLILTNITMSALIEFILSELTLSYYLELFLIGIFLPINFLFLVSQTKLEYKATENVLKKILSLLNLIFLVYILKELYRSFNFLLSQETWFKFLIPFIYSILCCPLYYVFIILSDYEKVSHKIQDHFVLENDIDRKYINKLKRRKLLMTCGVVHKKYIYFDNEFSQKMRLANTEDKVKEIMGEFEESYKLQRNNKIDMPETLLVLGNGFDIQCGLESTYYSFLINVLRINYDKQTENEITENQVLSEYIGDIDYCNSEFEISYYYQDLRNNLIIDKLNIWYILLLYKKMLFKKNWNLIENQIMIELTKDKLGYDISEKILLGILKIELAKKYTRDKVRFYYKDHPFRIKENIYQIMAYNISEKCARVHTKNNSYSNLHFLLKEWINEVSIKITNQSFMAKVEISELKDLIDSVAEVLLEELKEVEKDFIEYLNQEIIRNTKYIENTKSLIKILIGVNNPFNIVSFNFTEPWSTEYNSCTYLNSLQLFINIHGSLLTNNIIFGIDENRISSDNSGYRFTKVSRIIELYTNDIKYKTPLYSILSSNINKIVFYGHSLAESDYGYFRIIFDEYAKKTDTIFEFCYTVYENTTKENEQRKLRDGISRLFGMYAEESEENKHVYKNLTLNNRIVFRQLPNIIENCQE